MTEEQTEETKPATKRVFALRGAERLKCEQFVELQIAAGHPRRIIVAATMQKFGVTEAIGADLYTGVMNAYKATFAEERHVKAREYERRLEGLYTLTIAAKDYTTSLGTLKALGRLWDVEGAVKLEVGGRGEYAERSNADLEFFAVHGHWPEPAKNPVPAITGQQAESATRH